MKRSLIAGAVFAMALGAAVPAHAQTDADPPALRIRRPPPEATLPSVIDEKSALPFLHRTGTFDDRR